MLINRQTALYHLISYHRYLHNNISPDLIIILTNSILKMSWIFPTSLQTSSPLAGRVNMATNISLVRKKRNGSVPSFELTTVCFVFLFVFC